MAPPQISENKRISTQSTPKDLESKLSLEQLLALRQLESFGWSLRFVRQPLFQDPVPIVIEGNGKSVGILQEDGTLKIDVDIDIRKDT